MGKSWKENPHKYRKFSDNKPQKHKSHRNDDWKPMGGSAQQMYEDPSDEKFESPPEDFHD